MVRFSIVFFFWFCNKRGGFLSPCFPLDLFYCYRIFVSQNWPRTFVNQSRIFKIGVTEAGNFDSGNQQQAARGQQHMLPASARCTRSGSSARLAAHAASSARCKPAAARSSQRSREAWLVRAARAGTGCARSKQRARPAWPVARAARAASCVREFGAFPTTWRRVVRRRRWLETVNRG